MIIQVESSASGTGRRSKAVPRAFALVCVLLYPILMASAHQQARSSRGARDRFCFQVTDSGDDRPIPEAVVSLVYWQKKGPAQEKKEMEIKTDANGIAEFRKVDANKLTIRVTAKGYRPRWQWIHRSGSEEATRIRLEKWSTAP
jgi:hypothetical protein